MDHRSRSRVSRDEYERRKAGIADAMREPEQKKSNADDESWEILQVSEAGSGVVPASNLQESFESRQELRKVMNETSQQPDNVSHSGAGSSEIQSDPSKFEWFDLDLSQWKIKDQLNLSQEHLSEQIEFPDESESSSSSPRCSRAMENPLTYEVEVAEGDEIQRGFNEDFYSERDSLKSEAKISEGQTAYDSTDDGWVASTTEKSEQKKSDETTPRVLRIRANEASKESLQCAGIETNLSILKREKDSSFKFILDIPFYCNPNKQQCALLGFIDLSEPFEKFGTSHELTMEGTSAHYALSFSERMAHSKSKYFNLHNIPLRRGANVQPYVKVNGKRPCRECKQCERKAIPKIPDTSPYVQCTAFNNEHSFLFLFQKLEFCYPLCLEYDQFSQGCVTILVDGKDYAFSKGPANVHLCGANSLSIIAYYHDDVFSTIVPDFDPEKSIVLVLGHRKYEVKLTGEKFKLKDQLSPKIEKFLGGETFFRVAGNPDLFFKLTKENEILVDKTAEVFQKNRWSFGDTVKAKALTGFLDESPVKGFNVDLKLGQSGTIVVRSNGIHETSKLFKVLPHKNRKVIVVEKFLKMSFNYSKLNDPASRVVDCSK